MNEKERSVMNVDERPVIFISTKIFEFRVETK